MFRKTLAILALSLFVSGSVVAADLSLEPCVNGDVSADGLSPTDT